MLDNLPFFIEYLDKIALNCYNMYDKIIQENAERIEFSGSITDYPNWLYVPFWKEVSERGFLQESSVCSRDRQEIKLKEEGFHIVPCGAKGQSLKVESYKDHLFNFYTLR